MAVITKSIKISEDFLIKSFESNSNNFLKPSVLLHYLEEIAYNHAEKFGFGYSATYPNGYGWFLLKCHIRFFRCPKVWEQLRIETWAVESRGILCRRDFAVFDSNNETIAVIATNWGLVNIESKKLVNPFKILEFPILYPDYAFETNFEKIVLPADDLTNKKEFEIRYDDIDLNGHVNNAVYLCWATETLPVEFLTRHTLSEIEIYFKKESKYDQKILSEVFFNENEKISVHSIKDLKTNEELTSLRLKWKQEN